MRRVENVTIEATYNKSRVAQKCLKVMCETHKLGLLGRRDCKLPGMCHELGHYKYA